MALPVQRLSYRTINRIRGRIWLMMMLLLLTIPLQHVSVAEAAYLCSPTTSCASGWGWTGPTYGSHTEVNTVGLQCSGCDSGGFIANGMWLYDTTQTTTGCRAAPRQWCWVEEGYSVFSNTSAKNYYWADYRPNSSGGSYGDHELCQCVSTGGTASLYIYNGGGQVWVASIYDTGTGFSSTNYSTSNSMSSGGNRIEVGMEMATSNGSPSAPNADFIHNQWRDSSGTYHYQTATASSFLGGGAPPPYSNYGQFSNGQDVGTYCC